MSIQMWVWSLLHIYKWNNVQTKSMATDDEVTYEVSIGAYYPSVGAYDADQ